MPIPGKANITEKHVRQAIELIDRDRYDPMYESSKYVLVFNRRDYPPKHVVRLANKFANGGTLDDLIFYPSEAIRLLKSLGFTDVRNRQVRGTKPKIPLPPEPVNRDKRVSDILFQLEQILKNKRLLAPSTDLYNYINELSRQGYIPDQITGLMHAIRKMRNVFIKKRVELTDTEFATIEANWAAIQEWAKK